MNSPLDLTAIKQIPILDVAKRLGIQVNGTKAMCFMGHDKASPSLSFHKSHNTWRCFGACGKHGDGITLVMEKEGVDFNSALDWFARNYSIDIPGRHGGGSRRWVRRKIPAVPSAQTATPEKENEFSPDPEIYSWFIDSCAPVSSSTGIEYLKSHAITPETAIRFRLRELSDPDQALRKLVETWGEQRVYRSGIAWGKDGHPERLVWSSYALLFPFYEQGLVTYIQARMFAGNKKFLNLRGVAKPLFNSDRLKELRAGKSVHICEGVPDAIALEGHGLNAVGVLGATSFRADWVEELLKFKVILLGDGDLAGEKFTNDISSFFLERGKVVHRMSLPEGQDVADVLAQGGAAK